MTFQDIVDLILNPVFGWLLDIEPIVAIIFLAVLLGLVSTLLQKYLTDQAKMKRLKDDTKKLQTQVRELQKKKEMDKALKLQQKMMPLQMDLMKESFRPLLFTMVPFLLIFFWLAHHFAYLPILPGEQFTVTVAFEKGAAGNATLVVPEGLTIDAATQQIADRQAQWTLSGPGGTYPIKLQYAGAEFDRQVLITTERAYETPVQPIKGSVSSFDVDNAKLLPLGENFNLFGWRPGWIFYYIILSIPVSLLLKKLLQVV